MKVGIIGSGNIGSDLFAKVVRKSAVLEVAAMVGVDPDSEGLAIARKHGIETTAEGLDGLTSMRCWQDIDILFDATSAGAHEYHSDVALKAGKRMIDLTPAAIGPYVVPVVNGSDEIDKPNINMVTCGGQASDPHCRGSFQHCDGSLRGNCSVHFIAFSRTGYAGQYR